MRKIVLTTIILFEIQFLLSQAPVNNTASVDLLKSAGNPAFNMLGLAESDIHRPTDLANLAISLRAASSNFIAIPKNLGLELAPFLMGKIKYTLDDFKNAKKTFKQSFSISTGFANLKINEEDQSDSINTTKLGLGIKFSIIRAPWSDNSQRIYNNIVQAQKNALRFWEEYVPEGAIHTNIKNLEQKKLDLLRDRNITDEDREHRLSELDSALSKLDELKNIEKNETFSTTAPYKALQSAIKSFKNEREGLYLDFVSGLAIDFPTKRFNYSTIHKAGAWLTGGYDSGIDGISSMFIARYLYQPGYTITNPNNTVSQVSASSFDIGARALIHPQSDKFNISMEYLHRWYSARVSIPTSWRLVFNAEYDLGKNQKITFAFGKHFDGGLRNWGNQVII